MSINTTRVLFHKTMVSLNVYAHPAMHSQSLDQKQCRCLERSTACRSLSPQLNKTYPMFSSWSRLQHRSELRTANVHWSCHFPPPCYDNEKGAYWDSVKQTRRTATTAGHHAALQLPLSPASLGYSYSSSSCYSCSFGCVV